MTRLKPIQHGTNAGFQQHRRHHNPVCEPCRQARNAYDTRRRRASGQQPRDAGRWTSIPSSVLADLYLHTTPAAQIRAEAAIPDGVLELAVKRYDQENL